MLICLTASQFILKMEVWWAFGIIVLPLSGCVPNTTWPTLTSARASTLAVSYSVIRTYLFQDNIRVCHFIVRFKCRFALLFSYRTLSMLFCFNRWLFDKAGLLLNRPAQGGQSAIIRPHCKGTNEKHTVYALKCNHPKIWNQHTCRMFIQPCFVFVCYLE